MEELQEKKRHRSSFSPSPEVERMPRLDREFRRPPPPHQHKRRKPSRGHLQHIATAATETTPTSSSGQLILHEGLRVEAGHQHKIQPSQLSCLGGSVARALAQKPGGLIQCTHDD